MEAVVRNASNLNTEALLLFCALALVTVSKLIDEGRFQHFVLLFFSDKYLKLYGKDQNLTLSAFNILLFLAQVLCYGLLISYTIHFFNIQVDKSLLLIFTFLGIFILFKFYTEKIIATVFNITAFTEQLHFEKLSYRNLTSLFLLPLVTLLIFSPLNKKIVLFTTIILFVFLNFIGLLLTLKNHQKSIANKFIYFILYLCALEIAPYLIMAKLLVFK